jgi:hypothetical protein
MYVMKKIFILLLSICASYVSIAQSNVTQSYSIGFGNGDLGGFISKTSWRGYTLDYRYIFKPQMAFGITVGWQTFYEELDNATYTKENASLSGKQFRYSNNVPILATFTYFTKPDDHPVNPFVSLGIGTMYTRRNTDMNLYTVRQDAWNFLLQPEIGVQLHISDEAAFSISGKYNYGFKAGELSDPQSYFTLNVGFSFF